MSDELAGAIALFFGTVAYLLLGSFLAWLLGAAQGSVAYIAIVLLWPIVGAFLTFAAFAMMAFILGMLRAVFGERARS